MPDKKNRWNLIIFAVIVLLLVGSIFFLWMRANDEVRSIVEDQYQNQQLILTQYVSSSLEELLNERVLLLEVMARNEQGVPEDLFISDFENIYKAAEIYHVLEFIDANGTVVSGYPSENVPLGYNLHENDNEWAFENVRKTGEVYISEPAMTQEGIFGSFVWVPVFEEGEFKGTIFGIVSDEDIIRQFETTSNSSNSVYLLNSRGEIIYDQSGMYEKGTVYLDYIKGYEVERLDIVRSQMNGLEGNGKYPDTVSNGRSQDILVSYSPVTWYNKNWSLGLSSPGNTVDKIIVSVYVKLFTVAGLSVLFILFLSSQVYFILLNWNRSLEKEVKKKTHELQRSNDSLISANLKLRELDRLKTEFLSMVSHELKTPLTAMKTSSEFLLEGKCNQDTRTQILALINRNVDRQARMVDDLLDISRIESNRMKFEMESVDLREVLDHSIENVHKLSEDKGIGIEVDMPEEVSGVYADKDKLVQVFVNLLNNSLKFTQEGGKITVSAQEKAKDVEVCVMDDGIGIDPEYLEHIFDKFYQIDSTSTRKVGGCGLGLAITRGIVEGMGGSIRAVSEPGNGSTFIFTLGKVSDNRENNDFH
ncbi:sensor histidine kinase [Methanolobus halotolerans]|uniref:histidine kinase n=1 Tax=Methanolobus halotolerans TaxID=2052935 RepID=A0A4E0Q035_9EURY|nr:sensor histidine kinase [Methanolobus halotolerans]TGC09682.1 histidine kinase [Methanolobus halotolerans]